MPTQYPMDALAEVARDFGLEAASKKLKLLESLTGLRKVSVRRLRR